MEDVRCGYIEKGSGKVDLDEKCGLTLPSTLFRIVDKGPVSLRIAISSRQKKSLQISPLTCLIPWQGMGYHWMKINRLGRILWAN